ncbi:hypothetical protein ACN47E_009650 [Coniothyrium glycines]
MPTHLAHPSPKRKRDQAPPAPLLNTTLRIATTPPGDAPPPVSRPESPRNEVADRLRGMSLTNVAAIPMSPLTPTDDVLCKKPKLDEMRVDSVTSLNTHATNEVWRAASDQDCGITLLVGESSEHVREIPETPQMVQPRILPDIASFAQTTTFESSPVVAPPYKGDISMHLDPRTHHPSSSHHLPQTRSSSPPLSALTWKDSEITGHLADPSIDPDDDGTGINGIGFRPTPALAYARSQKRRQQINEWKARETREARAKRSERRRRGAGGMSSREVTVEREMSADQAGSNRRTVKFAV